jgi:mannose-6-phosphate isomerase-like protein (cupin superfamily)
MPLKFEKSFFSTLGDVLEDVRKNGTWPTTYVSGPSEGMETHWHSEEVHAYIMEGETDFLDAESGERVPVSAGDKIIVPARTAHAEGPVKDRVVYLLALPEPLAPDEFLKLRPLEELG